MAQSVNSFAPPLPAASASGMRARVFIRAIAWLNALGRMIVALGERSSVMRAVARLNATSDADLAARGLTREGELRRLFAGRLYL